MLAVAIPRAVGRSEKTLPVRRTTDYHTVQYTKTAEGKIKDTHLTYRQYLCDAAFGVVLSGEHEVLDQVAHALDDPVWGVWLGRKACVPATPVFTKPQSETGWVFASEDEALRTLIGDTPLERFTHQREVENFAGGVDTLPDQPISFGSAQRAHAPRRVLTVEAKIDSEA
jgi:CRISPR system Cascade subunit CasD